MKSEIACGCIPANPIVAATTEPGGNVGILVRYRHEIACGCIPANPIVAATTEPGKKCQNIKKV